MCEVDMELPQVDKLQKHDHLHPSGGSVQLLEADSSMTGW